MALSLAEILSGSFGSEADYLGQNPYFSAGRSLAGLQLPAPRSNTEAFFGPLAQGLAAGGLLGYGREQANQAAFKDYSSILNPRAGMIGPLSAAESIAAESNPYSASAMPEGWSARTGRSDLLQKLLAQQSTQEAEQKKKEFMFKYSPEAIEGERELQAIKDGVPAVPGVPKNLQGDALKEVQTVAQKEQSTNFIREKFAEAKDLRGVKAALPEFMSDDSAALGGMSQAIVAQLDKALGREVNDAVRAQYKSLTPKWYDNDTTLKRKEKDMIALTESLFGATPIIDTAAAKSGAGASGSWGASDTVVGPDGQTYVFTD